MESKSREQFEAWFSDNGRHPKAVDRDALGYKLAAAENQWQAWKQSWRESRTARVVDISADDIKRIFLENGFKEKTQPDGSIDLNPYVYDAALALLEFAAGITVKGEGDEKANL